MTVQQINKRKFCSVVGCVVLVTYVANLIPHVESTRATYEFTNFNSEKD